MSAPEPVWRGADFSPCRTWRYTLRRSWLPLDEARSGVLFVCLNPSTADETQNDPTIRRLVGFAQAWGYTDLTVCNLFALRATDPRSMLKDAAPVGPENDVWIRREAERADLIVAAWGTHGSHLRRGPGVLCMLDLAGEVHHLGLTKDGHPKHPLYLRADTLPERFPASAFVCATGVR